MSIINENVKLCRISEILKTLSNKKRFLLIESIKPDINLEVKEKNTTDINKIEMAIDFFEIIHNYYTTGILPIYNDDIDSFLDSVSDFILNRYI